jgi:hypothetical protein
LKAGVEVVICHLELVETGLDLQAFPTLYFYEIGYLFLAYAMPGQPKVVAHRAEIPGAG